MSRALLLFVRLPEPGRVKTRLARETSDRDAAALYDVLARHCLAQCLAGAQAAKGEVLVFHDPESDPAAVAEWLGPGPRYLVQRGPDLGSRMADAFERAFGLGFEAAVLVGSDIPGMRPGLLADALAVPAPDTAVLGPAEDGGYWLIGFHAQGFAPRVFERMPWSTPLVCAETMRRLAEAGLDLRLAPQLADVDVLDDLARVLDDDQLDPASETGGVALELLSTRPG